MNVKIALTERKSWSLWENLWRKDPPTWKDYRNAADARGRAVHVLSPQKCEALPALNNSYYIITKPNGGFYL